MWEFVAGNTFAATGKLTSIQPTQYKLTDSTLFQLSLCWAVSGSPMAPCIGRIQAVWGDTTLKVNSEVR
jgi:hypothetical protein